MPATETEPERAEVVALGANLDLRVDRRFTPEISGSPLLGEHTDDVLTELGYDADTITRLHADHVA